MLKEIKSICTNNMTKKMKFVKKIKQRVRKNGKHLFSRFYKMLSHNKTADEVNIIIKKKLKKLFRRGKLSLNKNLFITYTTSSGFSISGKFFTVPKIEMLNDRFKTPKISHGYFDSIINMKEKNITIKSVMITYY